MQATHYYETFRELNKQKTVTGPLRKIGELKNSLTLTKRSNCKTIAIFKIQFKPGCEPKAIINE